MDPLLEAKIHNAMSELSNEADKTIHDPSVIYALMHHAVNVFKLTLTHVGYLESKVQSLTAENQRLNQIAKY
jgi:hypothetical protein